MIFYFSGTGNSKWIAEKIAEKVNDKTYDILSINKIPDIQNENLIGFVFPIYAWGIPELMTTFIKKLQPTKAYTFGICTCGSEAGLALKKFSKLYRLDSSYSVIMPSNYIIAEDVENESVILNKIENAKEELDIISNEIIQKKKVYRVTEGKFATLKSSLINMGFNKFARKTDPFYVDKEKCNSCGLCSKICPASTISLVNGNPVWNKKCYQCLRCINYCPQKAIQYGKSTENRGRYNIEKYI